MSFPFDPLRGLIVVRAELWGPTGSAVLQLALDTGATGTLVNVGMLVALGYDPALSPDRFQVTTGSGVEFVPRIKLDKIKALDQERTDFLVLAIPCHPAQESMACSGWIFFAARVCCSIFEMGS